MGNHHSIASQIDACGGYIPHLMCTTTTQPKQHNHQPLSLAAVHSAQSTDMIVVPIFPRDSHHSIASQIEECGAIYTIPDTLDISSMFSLAAKATWLLAAVVHACSDDTQLVSVHCDASLALTLLASALEVI